MPYDEQLDRRIRQVVSRWKGSGSKKMFGGVCHLLHGNMFCGVHQNFLILRLGEEKAIEALEQPHTRPFDITGKPMKGWVMVAGDDCEDEADLRAWLEQARLFVRNLPPKGSRQK
jgi:TfoX/Sxy family transcriptional regulator of competence genes